MSMLACHGCEDFTCVRGLTLRSIPTEDDLILQWMKQHKLVWDEISKCRCGGRVVERRGHLECTDRGCRGRYPLLGPLLDSWQRCSPQKIIALLYCCAVGIGHKVAKREVSVANGTCAILGKEGRKGCPVVLRNTLRTVQARRSTCY